MRAYTGFTLMELMITVAILAIVATFALPNLGGFFDKKRLIAGAEGLYGELQSARSEAVARSQNIIVSIDRDGNRDWDLGMIAGAAACNPDVIVNTAANACVLRVDDGDADAADAADENILRRMEHEDYVGVNLTGSTFDYSSNAHLTFSYVRGTATAGSITLQSDYAAAGEDGGEIRVLVNALGRVSLCSPPSDASGNNKVGGYPDC